MSSRLTGAYKIRPYEHSTLLKDRFIFKDLSNLTLNTDDLTECKLFHTHQLSL